MLKDIKRDCEYYARLLGDYQSMTEEELLDGYCNAIDTEDDRGKSKYLAALMLRFWYVIDKFYRHCPGLGLERSDFYTWLQESINYACKYRAWQNPEKHVNGKQAINKCIATIRLQHYYDFNLDKAKANYNNISLDSPFQEGSEEETSILDTLKDNRDLLEESTSGVRSIAQTLINENRIMDAIIVDIISYGDSERCSKEKTSAIDSFGNEYSYQKTYREFWRYRAVQNLGNIDNDYEEYFINNYKVKENDLKISLAAIKKSNNQKLYKYLDACLNSLKKRILTN